MPPLSPPRVLVLVPTYNEIENIAALVDAVFGLGIDGLEMLVVDDRSPDGTAARVRLLEARYPGLRLLERSGPAGRGRAGRDAFCYGLECGASYLIEMDADFSHQPRHIPQLLAAMEHCDVAVGSRRVPGGSDSDRPWPRRLLTRLANAYARRLLGLPVLDVNSGFRCFSRLAVERIRPSELRSTGPSILHEMLHKARGAGLRITEVPIEFVERKAGSSKLNLALLASGYFWVLRCQALTFLTFVSAKLKKVNARHRTTA